MGRLLPRLWRLCVGGLVGRWGNLRGATTSAREENPQTFQAMEGREGGSTGLSPEKEVTYAFLGDYGFYG